MKIIMLHTLYLLLLLSSSATAQSKILNPSQIYRLVERSTVTIVTDNEQQGSGFYVAPNVVATNYHVVEGASDVQCIVTNTNVKVWVVGYVAVSKSADLILLRVTGSPRTSLKMAKGKVATGQVVYAVGAPLGMSGTISNGIVSAVRGENILQITAPISQGSSGGPVVNRVGEVVGVSTLTSTSGQNMNFAVGYQYVNALLRQMRSKPLALASLHGTAQQPSGRQASAAQQGSSDEVESFRKDFSVYSVFNPETEQWTARENSNTTFVFNANDNGDVIIYDSDGSKEVYRKVSGTSNKTDRDGLNYQEIVVLDESGNEVLLRLYEDGDVVLIGEGGGAMQLSN